MESPKGEYEMNQGKEMERRDLSMEEKIPRHNQAEKTPPNNPRLLPLIVATLADPENATKSNAAIARLLGLGERTLYRYLCPSTWALVKEHQERHYIPGKPTVEVHRAIIDKAIGGNIQAQRLFCQRFEGMGAAEGYDAPVSKIIIHPPKEAGTQAVGIVINPPRRDEHR
jgi:hypothetical protein